MATRRSSMRILVTTLEKLSRKIQKEDPYGRFSISQTRQFA